MADFMRQGECGPEARLFEPGPPDFEVKAKEISRLASRDALLLMAGIGMAAIALAGLIILFTR